MLNVRTAMGHGSSGTTLPALIGRIEEEAISVFVCEVVGVHGQRFFLQIADGVVTTIVANCNVMTCLTLVVCHHRFQLDTCVR